MESMSPQDKDELFPNTFGNHLNKDFTKLNFMIL